MKRYSRKFLICRRQNAVASNQMMAPLPNLIVEPGWYPFQYVGVDYFGPFSVTSGRRHEKIYGCLFTCLQCRAIHLELAQSLSTDSFILALMTFVNRRGTLVEIHSDNGSNFVGAKNELHNWLTRLDRDKICSKMLESRITWRFSPPLASHRGEIWERMIRSVRKILFSKAGKHSMNEEMLWTYLTHAERVVSDRPLTALRDDSNEPSPVRPSDLLHPMSHAIISINMPLGQMTERRWRRWKIEYLDTLQARQKWLQRRQDLAIGDVVIV